ncbi:unnamed protein product [Spirodela intermedia]|uniref:Uncharacterized protein n=1 Tax=Spirodela intermedia TaxID=51605 RepID=A0A7I8LCL1_SPIIN|nr:unnamed protein product [Spirodela intermedia]
MATCGAHPLITNPLPAVRSSNPSGAPPYATALPAGVTRRHQTNREPLRSSAAASAAVCAGFSSAWLPKQTYTTVPAGQASSQAMAPAERTESPSRSPSPGGASGPTAHTRRCPSSARRWSRYGASKSMKVLKTYPQLEIFCKNPSLTNSQRGFPSLHLL